MRTHHAIVADLYQIVELDARLYDSITQSSTVNTCIRANLHRVANNDTTDLRNLALCPIWQGIEAKTIRPNDGTTVDHHSASKMHPRIETDMGIENATRANLARCTNIGAGIHRDIIPQSNTMLNHDIRTNVDACTEFHFRTNNSTGVNAPHGMLLWEEVFKQVNEA